MFNFSEKFKFVPWIGSEYATGYNGIKLLIVGDSHYGDPPGKEINFTRDVLGRHLSGEKRVSFFTLIARAITGEANEQLNQDKFWNTVAFYNYIQTSMDDFDVRPTSEQAIEAQDAFKEALDVLQPDRLILLGNMVWDMTPSDGKEGYVIILSNTNRQMLTWHYPTNTGKVIYTGKMEHASSRRFSPDSWHPLVESFFAENTAPVL